MALARLVTRTPEFAQNLARSLEDAGYTVEFASPDVVSHGVLLGLPLAPADIEVNLDDPSTASSYLMTAEGKEIFFAYDAGEREFVLAPAWRRLKAAFAPLRDKIQLAVEHRRQARWEAARLAEAQREERSVAAAPAEPARLATVAQKASPPEIVPPASEPAAETPWARSLYLHEPASFAVESEPEPVEFTGAEYFDGQGARKIAGHESAPADPHRDAPAELQAADSEPPLESRPSQAPWLVTAALRAEALRASFAARVRDQWQQKRTSLTNGKTRLRGYDAAWLRAAPVAAVITLAFLLGWATSSSQQTSSPTPIAGNLAESNPENLQQAAMLPVAASAPILTVKPNQPAAAKRAAARDVDSARSAEGEDADVAPDVIIRHYPSKGTRAAAPKGGIKRFSDLD